MAGFSGLVQVASLRLVTKLHREEYAGKGVEVGGGGVTALGARLVIGIGCVGLGVDELGGTVGQVGHDAAVLLAEHVVVIIDAAHVIQIVGEGVADAPFGAETDVAADGDLEADTEGDGKAGEGVAFGGYAVGVGDALALGAEALQLIPRAVGVLGLRVEGEEGETGEDIGCEPVLLRGVVEFQEVELGLHGEFRDGRHKAEVALCVQGARVGGGDLAEQDVGLEGPAGREVVAVHHAARQVAALEEARLVEVAKIEGGADEGAELGTLGARRRGRCHTEGKQHASGENKGSTFHCFQI